MSIVKHLYFNNPVKEIYIFPKILMSFVTRISINFMNNGYLFILLLNYFSLMSLCLLNINMLHLHLHKLISNIFALDWKIKIIGLRVTVSI